MNHKTPLGIRAEIEIEKDNELQRKVIYGAFTDTYKNDVKSFNNFLGKVIDEDTKETESRWDNLQD